MTISRELVRSYSPQREKGFLGPGHTASALINGSFKDTDPFILLMDDNLDKKDYSPAGGPHPHAGFETVSLLIDGEIVEMIESMKKGDFQIMTAGSGIVHTETINQPTKGRLFQLWLDLPKKSRWIAPRLQILPSVHVPLVSQKGISIRLYSGSLNGVQSPVQNHVPLLVAEVIVEPHQSNRLSIPADFNAFLVIIEGAVRIGQKELTLLKGQVGWLDIHEQENESELLLHAGGEGVRFVLYAAKPVREPIISQGPFIADSIKEIESLYRNFWAGEMKHISTVPQNQRITY